MEGSKTAENCLLRLLCILLCLVAYTYGKATDGLMDDRIYGEENDLMKTNQQQKLQHYLEALKGVIEGIAPYEDDIASGNLDDGELYESKRGPPSGFMGARGKKLQPGFYGSRGKKDQLSDYAKRLGSAGFYGVRGKKADVTDIIGQRDSRNPPMGFMGSRGKKSNPLSGFMGARGKKAGPPKGFFAMRGKKVPPVGFMGARGKRLPMTEESLAQQLYEASREWPQLTENDIDNGLDKRNPGSMGFHAMRGKR